MKPVYIVAARRTAIGSFGGSLKDVSAANLGQICVKACLENLPEDLQVDEVITGNVLGAGQGMNLSRQISVGAGLSQAVPAYTINKVCGSGLKAVSLAATEVGSGNLDCVVAGGVENMSQAGFVSLTQRFGNKMGNATLVDLMINDGLTDIFNNYHMGITAENLAEKYSISRQAQDQFAFESQSKAKAALEAGWFKSEIVPVPLIQRGKQVGTFEQDEYPRLSTLEKLSELRPAFKSDGTVTAGNASGINDGAAYLVLASEGHVKKYNLNPIAQIKGFASGGVDPSLMGIGPVEAVKKLVKNEGVKLDQLDVIESNEAFASQALAVNQLLEWDPGKINLGGGAIALGHPIGASGARILVTLLHHMQRTSGRLGLATLCIGGGQGIAVLVEKV